jgi:membrane-bound lytic murein transglycosylase A
MHDVLRPVSFKTLQGWPESDLATAAAAFRRSASEILKVGSGFRRSAAFGGERADWLKLCETALASSDEQAFFENHFIPCRVHDDERPQGLFTGYYEPLLLGSLNASADYPVPVYAKPSDLVSFTSEENLATGLSYGRRVNDVAKAYDTREDIECGSLAGKAEIICWLADWVDAFFMHVQGQGRVALPDGRFIRLSYAGKTGHPYTGIGHVLIERGVAPKHKMSMQVLRDWMRDHQEKARALMWQNKSYIFFQSASVTDEALGGIGAAKVNLTPLHTLAIDRAWWMFGTPLWIDTVLPPEAPDADKIIRKLMIAQDTGSAIKGKVRGDFFWGWRDNAAIIAGNMKSAGTMTALLPLTVARRLGLVQ